MNAPLKLEAQPLYARVRAALVGRLIARQWKPGQGIPSENALAAELGVSQGTVRKALDEMTASGLLVRRQGKGTFVAEAEDQAILFRFYRLTADGAAEGETGFPRSTYLHKESGLATQKETEFLSIRASAPVLRFERLRWQGEAPLLWERLVLPQTQFEGLTETHDLPNNVYQFYGSQFCIIVARVEEKLKAVLADASVAGHLQIPTGTPLLRIDRQAIALDETVVEWRRSLVRCDTHHYRNVLT
ncbi:MAG: GntR family transcriptional regulator [Pseudomonadota bacterium]